MPYIINKQGQKVGDNIFEEILPYSEGYAPFKHQDKWGMLGMDGEIVIPAMYQECKCFTGGLAPVKVNDKWGFINPKNEVIIPFNYDGARNFYEGFASVKQGEYWTAINKEGTPITEYKFKIISWFYDGIAEVSINGRWSCIDTSGKEIIPPVYKMVNPFHNGYATVKDDNNKCGIIDKIGTIIVPCQYDEILNVMENLVAIRNRKLFGFLNMQTNTVEIPFQYKNVKMGFVNGVCFVKKEGHYGAINKKGEQVLPFVFLEIKTPSKFFQKPFNEGLAIVSLDKNKGAVNAESQIMESLNYDPDNYLEFNLKWNRGNKPTSSFDIFSWGIISIREADTGKVIVPFIYRKIEDYSNGLALIKDINYSGYVDTDGNIAIPLADFGFSTSFSEDRAIVDTHNYYDY